MKEHIGAGVESVSWTEFTNQGSCVLDASAVLLCMHLLSCDAHRDGIPLLYILDEGKLLETMWEPGLLVLFGKCRRTQTSHRHVTCLRRLCHGRAFWEAGSPAPSGPHAATAQTAATKWRQLVHSQSTSHATPTCSQYEPYQQHTMPSLCSSLV